MYCIILNKNLFSMSRVRNYFEKDRHCDTIPTYSTNFRIRNHIVVNILLYLCTVHNRSRDNAFSFPAYASETKKLPLAQNSWCRTGLSYHL
jgi:hypothetical protein